VLGNTEDFRGRETGGGGDVARRYGWLVREGVGIGMEGMVLALWLGVG